MRRAGSAVRVWAVSSLLAGSLASMTVGRAQAAHDFKHVADGCAGGFEMSFHGGLRQ